MATPPIRPNFDELIKYNSDLYLIYDKTSHELTTTSESELRRLAKNANFEISQPLLREWLKYHIEVLCDTGKAFDPRIPEIAKKIWAGEVVLSEGGAASGAGGPGVSAVVYGYSPEAILALLGTPLIKVESGNVAGFLAGLDVQLVLDAKSNTLREVPRGAASDAILQEKQFRERLEKALPFYPVEQRALVERLLCKMERTSPVVLAQMEHDVPLRKGAGGGASDGVSPLEMQLLRGGEVAPEIPDADAAIRLLTIAERYASEHVAHVAMIGLLRHIKEMPPQELIEALVPLAEKSSFAFVRAIAENLSKTKSVEGMVKDEEELLENRTEVLEIEQYILSGNASDKEIVFLLGQAAQRGRFAWVEEALLREENSLFDRIADEEKKYVLIRNIIQEAVEQGYLTWVERALSSGGRSLWNLLPDEDAKDWVLNYAMRAGATKGNFPWVEHALSPQEGSLWARLPTVAAKDSAIEETICSAVESGHFGWVEKSLSPSAGSLWRRLSDEATRDIVLVRAISRAAQNGHYEWAEKALSGARGCLLNRITSDFYKNLAFTYAISGAESPEWKARFQAMRDERNEEAAGV